MPASIGIFVLHGYFVLFLVVLAEQLGLPIPSIPVLLAMGAMFGGGTYGFLPALALCCLAALSADHVWYLLGARGNSVLKLLCRLSLEPDSCVSNTRYWFRRLGAWALVVAKFVPGLSTVAPPLAGLSKMPWWRFVIADGAGAMLWSGVYLGLGFVFRAQLEELGHMLIRLGSSMVLGIILALALWILFKYWQRQRFIRTLRTYRVTPKEVFEKLKDSVIIDLRLPEEVERTGKIAGALWFDRRQLEQRHQEIPRDRDVVLYCS